MDSSNLINPFSVTQQRAWHRWWAITGGSLAVLGLVFMAMTGYQLWCMYTLKKEIFNAQGAINHEVVQQHKILQEQQGHLEEKLAKMQEWGNFSLSAPLNAVSRVIPALVMLTEIDVEAHDVMLKGTSYSIEYVLEFLHNLEKTKLFSAMNLKELRSAREDHEKKLVNFVIKGKLEFKKN